MKNIKLIDMQHSPIETKKWRATFLVDGKDTVITDFGMTSGDDYTMHENKIRADWYRWRHMKDLKTNDPTRAGYLSMFILYNKTDVNKALLDYQKRLKIFNETGEFPQEVVGYVNPTKNANARRKPRKINVIKGK